MNGTIGAFCVLLFLFSNAVADDGNSSDFVTQLESALGSIVNEHVLGDVPTAFTNFSDAISTYRKDVHDLVLKSVNETESSSTINNFGRWLTNIQESLNVTHSYDDEYIRHTEELWNNSTTNAMTFEVYQIDRMTNSIFLRHRHVNYTIGANESQLSIWDYFQSLKNLSIVQAKTDEVKQKLWQQENFNTSSPCARVAADYKGYARNSARYSHELGLGLLTSLFCDAYSQAFTGSSKDIFDYVNRSFNSSLTSYFDFLAYGLAYNAYESFNQCDANDLTFEIYETDPTYNHFESIGNLTEVQALTDDLKTKLTSDANYSAYRMCDLAGELYDRLQLNQTATSAGLTFGC
ncbi:hypothetical protein M3Y96_01209400 [Aphelenchoides besseyi]|nr:hypothetical protein M3Y96_01209400 [Aphelenchoides besseyi]